MARFVNMRLTHLKQLRALDAHVWSSKAALNIQSTWQPMASSIPINTEFGSLCYRKVHYYSTDPTRPYVRLVEHRDGSLPLVICCREVAYDHFLRKLASGKFAAHDISIIIPMSYYEQVADL